MERIGRYYLVATPITIALALLRVAGIAEIHWLVITAPLWGPPALIFSAIFLLLACFVAIWMIGTTDEILYGNNN